MDYFPDEVAYAAAALTLVNAMLKMVMRQRVWLLGPALRRTKSMSVSLARISTCKSGRGDGKTRRLYEATDYRWRTAVAFRESNVRAAEEARRSVVYHYVVRVPNHEKLLAFCNEVGGFGWRTPIAKPEESPAYWSHALAPC